MNATKKRYGFRLNEPVPNWSDRLGRGGGRVIQLIRLKYCQKFQVHISNGDKYTSEFILQDDFHKRQLANNDSPF